MKKVKTVINDYIKRLDGKIIGIGLDDNHINQIAKNDKIIYCDLLDNDNKSDGSEKGRNKILYFKDIRKKYKKKKIDYIIADMDKIFVCKRTFIKDSIYINKNKIIYYVDNNTDYQLILKRYKIYNVDIEITECHDGKIIVINTKQAKNRYFKDKLYYILDSLYELFDIIGDLFAT